MLASPPKTSPLTKPFPMTDAETSQDIQKPRTKPPLHLILSAGWVAVAAFVFPSLSFQNLFWVVFGAGLLAAGIWLMLRTRLVMARHGTTYRYEPSARVVETDVFAFSRNPMYVGMTAVLLGGALALGNGACLAGPVYFFLVLDRVFVPYEERKMAAELGAPYLVYKARVRRWF